MLQNPKVVAMPRSHDSHLPAFASLTKRQRDILELTVRGYTAKEIADQLKSSVNTISNHKKAIFFRLSVSSTIGLIMEYARCRGLEPSIQNLTGYDLLSPRERHVVEALLEGKEPQTAAEKLHVSVHTVRNHLKRIYIKLGVDGYHEIVALAFGLNKRRNH